MKLVLPAAALVAAATLIAPAPAQAHPFGPPQTVEVSASGGRVLVRWAFGGTDDISYLAVALGVLGGDRTLLDGAVVYQEGDDTALAAAPQFADYVGEHIRVSNAGDGCEGAVESVAALASDGVTVSYDCPGGLGSVSVAVDMMLDLHPAYRTLATGPDGQRAVYDAADLSHDWALGDGAATLVADSAAAGLGRSAAIQLGGVTAGLAACGALIALLLRRRRAARSR